MLTMVDVLSREALAIEAWRMDYNVSRPHMALGNLTPAEYLVGSGFCMAPIGAMQVGS